MAFCSKCGKELADGAQFCASCGTPVGEAGNDGSKRVQKFEGEIRKCPNCGAVLESFQAVCPSCGFELRGNLKVASSVQKLMDKIAELESEREEEGGLAGFSSQFLSMSANKTDTSIANVIKAFPVPNTVEEILEFMMLAVTNMDPSAFSATLKFGEFSTTRDLKSKRTIAEAWQTKMEQMYKKAAMTFASSPKFQEIKTMYDNKMAEINAVSKKNKRTSLIFFSLPILLLILLFGLGGLMDCSGNKAEAKETQRLEQLYADIKADISAGDYEDAELKFVDLKWSYKADYESQKENVESWKEKKEILQKQLESQKNQ